MSKNMKSFLSSIYWSELKEEINKEIAEIEIEILEKASEPIENQSELIRLTSKREAYTFLLNLPSELIEKGEELSEID